MPHLYYTKFMDKLFWTGAPITSMVNEKCIYRSGSTKHGFDDKSVECKKFLRSLGAEYIRAFEAGIY